MVSRRPCHLGDVLAGVGAVVVRVGVGMAVAIAIAGALEHGCSLLGNFPCWLVYLCLDRLALGIAMARRCIDLPELGFYRRASG